jgi:hypothetical protein
MDNDGTPVTLPRALIVDFEAGTRMAPCEGWGM